MSSVGCEEVGHYGRAGVGRDRRVSFDNKTLLGPKVNEVTETDMDMVHVDATLNALVIDDVLLLTENYDVE